MAKQTRRKAQQQKKNDTLRMWGVIALIILGFAAVWFSS
jgi:predicted nucleic acid-binding Zn ribbon protein